MAILYEYKCEKCGTTYEKYLSIDERDDPCDELCDICGGLSIVRLIGNNGGFRLGENGSVGWARDGYGSTYGDCELFKSKGTNREAQLKREYSEAD
jgi:putative FmdB family regulatory protein